MSGDEVFGRTVSQPDNGPGEPASGPPNRKVLRTLALVVLLGFAGVVAWATQRKNRRRRFSRRAKDQRSAEEIVAAISGDAAVEATAWS